MIDPRGCSEHDDDAGALALDPAHGLHQRIADWAAREPGRPYLEEVGTGRRETYVGFRTVVQRWARLLRDHGVGAGDRVVSLLPSSVDAHAVWLAASLLGAFEVPVNPELRGEFLRHVLTDAGARTCVVRPDQLAIVEGSGVDGLAPLLAPLDGSAIAGVAPLDDAPLPRPDDVSCVIYTSGTTGPAKGVVITWAQMAATVGRIPRSQLDGNDAVYSPWPMFHVTGRSPMFAMAEVGGRVVLRPKLAVDAFWSDVREHGCTSTTIGAIIGLLLDRPARTDDRDHPLRFVFFGKVGPDGWKFIERFGLHALSCYGSTEVGFPVVNRRIDAGTVDVAGWLRRGYEARVVDEDGRDAANGTAGELWIKPPDRRLILREYLNQPELTARTVVDGWYRTGDAVRRRDDGGFEFVDRMRDTIRRFGENISSTALENAVLGDDEVLECAAVGVPSPVTGQEVLLLVVPRPGRTIDAAALATRLRAVLPRYMNPAYIAVVDELPKTPNGKVRKVGLADTTDLDHVWKASR